MPAPHQNKPAFIIPNSLGLLDVLNIISRISITPYPVGSDQSIKPLLKSSINQFALLLSGN